MSGTQVSETDCFGEIIRNDAAIRLAQGSLSNPWERIQHRLLWFYGPVCMEDVPCAGPWPRLQMQASEHDQALQRLAAAYLSEDALQIVSAFHKWHDLVSNAEFWEYFAESEAQSHFEPVATAAEIESLRKNAVAFAAEPLATAARNAWTQQAYPRFRDSLALLQRLEFMGQWTGTCRENLLAPLIQRLADASTTLEQKYRCQVSRRPDAAAANRILCAGELHYFRQFVEPAWKNIAAAVKETDVEARSARAQAAEQLHLIALDHIWAGDSATTEELAGEAVGLATGTIIEERLRAALAPYLEAGEGRVWRKAYSLAAANLDDAMQLFHARFAPDNNATEDQREQQASIGTGALRFYRDSVEPLLKHLLTEFARCKEDCDRWRAAGAACLSKIAGSLAAAGEFAPAQKLVSEALALTTDVDRRAALQEELTRLKEIAGKTKMRQADEATAREGIKRARHHCRTLAAWSTRVREQEGYAQENQLVANEELLLFRSQVGPGLALAAQRMGQNDARLLRLRAEVAHCLVTIAIHYSWAGEADTADSLLMEALKLAEGSDAEATVREAWQERRRRAPAPPMERREETAASRPFMSRPAGSRPAGTTETFPKKLPLFASDRWRAAAAFTVLTIVVVACLAGAERLRVSTEDPTSQPAATAAPAFPQTSSKPPEAGATGTPGQAEETEPVKIDATPVTLKLRILLLQIHAEERTAQQIERQLAPLERELTSMRKASTAKAPSTSAELHDKANIYDHLRERQRNLVSQWKQDVRTRDRLIAGRGVAGTGKAIPESE